MFIAVSFQIHTKIEEMWKRRLIFLMGVGSTCVVAWGLLKFTLPDSFWRRKLIRQSKPQPLHQSAKNFGALKKLTPLFALKHTVEDSSIRSRGALLAIDAITSFRLSTDVEMSELQSEFLLLGNLCSYPQFITDISDSLTEIFEVACRLCENEAVFADEIIAAFKFLSNMCLTSEYIELVASSCCLKAAIKLLLRSSSVRVREQALTFLVNISSHRTVNSSIIGEFSLQGCSVEKWSEDAAKTRSSQIEIEKTNYLLKNLGVHTH